MTVAELIEALKAFPQDAPVIAFGQDDDPYLAEPSLDAFVFADDGAPVTHARIGDKSAVVVVRL